MKTTNVIALSLLAALGLPALACSKENKREEGATATKDDEAKGKKGKKHDETGTSGEPGKDDESVEPTAKVGKVGLADPTSDPTLVTAVKKVLADCGKHMDETFTGEKKRSLWSCGEPWKTFTGTKVDEKTAARTMVNLLEDPDLKVRAVGVYQLDDWGRFGWRSDPELAKRVVAALKNEGPKSPIDAAWARLVAKIEKGAGANADIAALMKSEKTPIDVKLNYVAWADADVSYEVTKAFADGADPKLVNAAVQGYLHHFKGHEAEACGYWSSHLDGPDATANQYAFGHLTSGWTGNTTGDSESEDSCTGGGGGPSEDHMCPDADLQKAVDSAKRTFEDGGKSNGFLFYGLGALVKVKSTPPAIKKATVELLKRMVEKKGYGDRAAALKALVENDRTQLGYAHKFAGDPELKSAVADLDRPGF